MKNVDMVSSIIDLYMVDYDATKDAEEVVTEKKPSRRRAKTTSYARQKKGYFKSKKRMSQLNDVAGYQPSGKRADVVQGMLRSHQLPMNECKCETTFGESRANKRRHDVANDKIREFRTDIVETV